MSLALPSSARAVGAAAVPAETARPQWRVGVETMALPLSDLGDDGRAIGYSVDLLRELARDQRADLVLVAKPWNEILADFQAGKIDVLAAAVSTPERRETMEFTEPHLLLSSTVFMRHGEVVPRFEDLHGRRIGALRSGPAWEYFVGSGFEPDLVAIPHLREGLRQLTEHRLDAVPSTRMIGYNLLREERIAGVEAAAFPLPGLEYALCCAVHRGDTVRRQALSQGLANLRVDGTYMRIHEKWLGPYEPGGWRWRDLQPFIIGAVLLAGAAIVALAWQRRMLRRIAEQAAELRASEERLKFVLEGGGDGSWDWDIVSGRTVRDARAATLFGSDLSTIGTAVDAISKRAHPDDGPAVRAMRERLLREGSGSLEFRATTLPGEWRWFLVRGRVIARDAEGRPLRAAGTITDITDRKNAEEERAKGRARMQEAQRLESLGVLAGGVAHDFNNLLTVILGNAGLASIELGPPATPYLEPIEEAARRAAELCSQMLAYAGRATVHRTAVELAGLITESRPLLVALAGARPRLHFNLPAENRVVNADRTQLRQVLMNFVLNAAEALPESGGDIHLSTRAATFDAAQIALLRPACTIPPGRYVGFEARDTGRGITTETLARIFEPFFTTKFTGRGLGLAAALGIARAHGGTITVESIPGAGATFCLWLPVHETPLPITESTNDHPQSMRFRGEILLVDDEAVVRSTLNRLLGRLGLQATEAESGEVALARLRAEPTRYSAAVIDLTMPGLDGVQTLERLRDVRPAFPALLVSGYSEEDVRDRVPAGGGVAFLHKPFQLDALTEKLAAVLPRAE